MLKELVLGLLIFCAGSGGAWVHAQEMEEVIVIATQPPTHGLRGQMWRPRAMAPAPPSASLPAPPDQADNGRQELTAAEKDVLIRNRLASLTVAQLAEVISQLDLAVTRAHMASALIGAILVTYTVGIPGMVVLSSVLLGAIYMAIADIRLRVELEQHKRL